MIITHSLAHNRLALTRSFNVVKKAFFRVVVLLLLTIFSPWSFSAKVPVHALYIPLADHYAGIVAYERYRGTFQYADFSMEQMPNWDLLRAKFLEGNADMAFVMSPLAMDMFAHKPQFRWIGLMHRDGNALAVNSILLENMNLAKNRQDRKPDQELAKAIRQVMREHHNEMLIGMPHLLSTHSVVLYQYLKNYNLSMSLMPNAGADVLAISVPPAKSPVFLKSQENRAFAAAFEQSLPWADIVETQGYGKVAWYSKDVIQWPGGHVECITIASDNAIADKSIAIKEVMNAIHIAGQDIERARASGGEALDNIVAMIRKHVPAHTEAAIRASLDPNLQVINYRNLNLDIDGLRLIMDIAVEGKILKAPIDINSFAKPQFNFAEPLDYSAKPDGDK